MKLSLKWLENYFTLKPDWELVWERLTAAGIEIEDIKPVGADFSGVVIARVIDCVQHPDADKLKLCTVDAGDADTYQIVCGAANVTAGVIVPFAKIGAVLPNGMVIAERKMRGLTSFGMLCSGEEIGISDDADGLLLLNIDAPIGVSIREYLALDDKIIEFKITPNRGDCLSVQGIVREISALMGYNTKSVFEGVDSSINGNNIGSENAKVEVENLAKEACPNYLTLVIKGVNNTISLPQNILQRLELSGFRSISPIVDLANYVMLETGQPLHAFDLGQVGNKLTVRYACANEEFKLLDGKEVVLKPNTLIIADANNNPAAIAGVMGGFNSGVTTATTDIILECAFFTPEVISGTAKLYGVNSEAASRFERGIDYAMQQKVLRYVATKIQNYCGGEIGELNITSYEDKELPTIELPSLKVQQLIGIFIGADLIQELLTKLDFIVKVLNHNILSITVPSYRFDIKIAEDIIEEIARSYGYDNIPAIMPTAQLNFLKNTSITTKLQNFKKLMVNLGFTEIISYAFIEDKFEEILGKPDTNAIKLQNPIANLNVMRTSLIADLVKTLKYNVNYGHKDVKLFELGRVFYNETMDEQPLKLAGLIHGNQIMTNGLNTVKAVDFYDLKSIVESVLSEFYEIKFVPCKDYSVLHSGRCAKIYAGQIELGIIGQLHPKLCQELGLSVGPYIFELDLNRITKLATNFELRDINKFPRVERDLAFIMNYNVNVGDIISTIKVETRLKNLIDANIFDIYQKQDEGNIKSVAVNFVFQANKTLTDDEIKKDMEIITNTVCSKFNATIRSE